jgi:nucleoid-associated protein YgaU
MFVRALIVGAVALLLWSVAAAGSDGAGAPRTYTVRPHDTLWSIAVANYAGDPREGVWRIQDANSLRGTLLVPGQRLRLP